MTGKRARSDANGMKNKKKHAKMPLNCKLDENGDVYYLCRPCGAYLPKDKFYSSSIPRYDHSCKPCMIKRNKRTRQSYYTPHRRLLRQVRRRCPSSVFVWTIEDVQNVCYPLSPDELENLIIVADDPSLPLMPDNARLEKNKFVKKKFV